MRNWTLALIVGVLLAATCSWADSMPAKWDSRIPLPKGATLVSSTQPTKGVVYSADFRVAGDFKELVTFYETQIPKSGFEMGPKASVPARKVCNLSFNTATSLDSVLITPDSANPGSFILHISYTPK